MSEKNGYVTRDQLFANPAKRRFVDAAVEGFGVFRVRSLTAGEQNRLNRANYDKRGTVLPGELLKSNARLLVACVVDGEGNPIFVDADIDNLLTMDANVFENVVAECSRHCGFADEDSAKN